MSTECVGQRRASHATPPATLPVGLTAVKILMGLLRRTADCGVSMPLAWPPAQRRRYGLAAARPPVPGAAPGGAKNW